MPTRTLRALATAALLALSPLAARAQSRPADTTLTLHLDQAKTTIAPEIYGQFSEHLGHGIYGGIWVGEDSPIPNTRGIRNDVVAALKKLRVPVLRWPGGCFADEYHWKDGIGPRDQRPKMINTHWGGVTESNAFGTHEFLDFCQQIGAQPYICGNVGSGSVREMMEWVEYMTSDADSPLPNLRRKNGREKPWKLKYFGVGNESWGCGGNMTPEFYADNFRRYNTFVKNYADNRVFRIACGPNVADYNWTDVLMKNVGNRMQGLSLHYYTLPTGNWKKKGSATEFDESAWHETLAKTLYMDELLTKHSAIMDKYDPDKKVRLVVDEWGTWYDVEPGTNPGFLYQQNTLRDALVAAVNLNLFHKHADRIAMANIAQMVNVLQSMILTDNEKMVLTPTYHVFEMYNVHQGATNIPLDIHTPDYSLDGKSVPAVSASASKDHEGRIHLSLANLDPNHPAHISAKLPSASLTTATGRILTAPEMNARNTFDHPDTLKPTPFDGAKLSADTLTADLPAKSVVVIELR